MYNLKIYPFGILIKSNLFLIEEKPDALTPMNAVLEKLGLKLREELRIVLMALYLPTAN